MTGATTGAKARVLLAHYAALKAPLFHGTACVYLALHESI